MVLHPGGRPVEPTADAGRMAGVEILRVAHGIAVRVLVVRVSARSWI